MKIDRLIDEWRIPYSKRMEIDCHTPNVLGATVRASAPTALPS